MASAATPPPVSPTEASLSLHVKVDQTDDVEPTDLSQQSNSSGIGRKRPWLSLSEVTNKKLLLGESPKHSQSVKRPKSLGGDTTHNNDSSIQSDDGLTTHHMEKGQTSCNGFTPTEKAFSQTPRNGTNRDDVRDTNEPCLPAESQMSVFMTPKPFQRVGRVSVPPPSPLSNNPRFVTMHGWLKTDNDNTTPSNTTNKLGDGGGFDSRRYSMEDDLSKITSVPGWEFELMDSQGDSPQRPSPSHPSQACAPDPRWKYRLYEAKLKARLEDYRRSVLEGIRENSEGEDSATRRGSPKISGIPQETDHSELEPCVTPTGSKVA